MKKLSKYIYELPKELVAQHPTDFRDQSRLLVYHRQSKKIEHKKFSDFKDYFEEGDVLVRNDTKVFAAELMAEKEKTGAKIQVTLLRELSKEQKLWDILVDPARKIRIGNKLYFNKDDVSLEAEVIDNTTSRGRTLRFLFAGEYEDYRKKIEYLGNVPLPTYIKRAADEEDKKRYQTIYAKNPGAVAAPTAGLHFSKQLLKRLEIKGVKIADMTLHISQGTFRPVDVEDLSKHKMDSEEVIISQETADMVNDAKGNKKRICAIGTTVIRGLESSVSTSGTLNAYRGWTNKFIYPPYNFSIADSLVTNFHRPKSTILMMVAAFVGYEETMNIYDIAKEEKYRFNSYGDAMIII
ncbi:MAG: tRNA preQ1(34) S-adenosylmethionine ribosyltransferase-isomerase QueA [Flavobacteriaceae bacterium]|nr:tRNA preQ1(34) S-adenosylmethionine ribosyltransferase-isomerase QueA [Flavobacteriaceae bacterium]MCY4215568.1 tRNA preQ1(34) S-adenosylmethionine ribosyltransferase-isomerase QueA [Flavobacteriaceae bacterium]